MTEPGKSTVAGAILCGGRSSRLGTDKALAGLAGKPLLQHVIERLEPQLDQLVLGTGRDGAGLNAFEYTLVQDVAPSHRGPLIGLYSALRWLEASSHHWLVLCPCDAPFLPLDLVERLLRASKRAGKPVAVARYEGVVQPTFSLWHRELANTVGVVALEQGRGGLMAMLDQLDYAIEDWQAGNPAPFFNTNTQADLEHAQRMLDDEADGTRR